MPVYTSVKCCICGHPWISHDKNPSCKNLPPLAGTASEDDPELHRVLKVNAPDVVNPKSLIVTRSSEGVLSSQRWRFVQLFINIFRRFR